MITRSKAVASLLSLFLCAGARADTAHAQMPFGVGRVNLDGDSTVVAMRTPGDRPQVDVMINGKGPFRLGVETGSPAPLILYPAAARRLQLDRGTVVDSVRVGGYTLFGVRPFLPAEAMTGVQLDGLIGLGAFRDVQVIADFTAHLLVISRDTLPSADGRTVIQGRAGPVGLLLVPLKLGPVDTALILDTQGGTGISIPPSLVAAIGTSAPPAQVGVAISPALNGPTPFFGARLSSDLRLGEYTIERPIVSIVDFTPQPLSGILGIHVLAQFRVSVDTRTTRVRFQRAVKSVPAAPPFRSLGIVPRYSDEGPLTVRAVLPGLPGARAGIAEGDTIVSIDGRPTEHFTPAEWDPIVQEGPTRRVELLRDGKRRVIALSSVVIIP